jgi:hypothetical protein
MRGSFPFAAPLARLRRLGLLLPLRLWRDRAGSALVELGAVMPVLTLLVMGGAEIGRYALLNQKLDRVASTMGDLVAQSETLTVAQIDQLFAATEPVAWPFNLATRGTVVITSVSLVSNQARINWQRRGGGGLNAPSRVGVAGGLATLPSGMVLRTGDTLIVAEVFFDFAPVLYPQVAPAARLYHSAFFRPRLGALNALG